MSDADSGDSGASALEAELSQLLVTALHLEDVNPSQLDPTAPLFGSGLGLDSIDALELAVALSKKYGVTISAEDESSKKSFASVRALAAYVAEHRST